MKDLASNIVEAVRSAISVEASLINLTVSEDSAAHELIVEIADNGSGTAPEQDRQAFSLFSGIRPAPGDDFGIPFLKASSEWTGGHFILVPEPGTGTAVTAVYRSDHADMVPVGDVGEAVFLLIVGNPQLDFVYRRAVDHLSFTLDTREMRERLGGDANLSSPGIAAWIREYLAEQEKLLSATGI